MCRFLVYKGKDEILLSHLILEPQHSILTQSYDSRLRVDYRRPHNGDGFGLGYYTHPSLGPDPCIFTSTTPAWNNPNLSRLASKTASSLIFAHVRATTEGNLSDSNCHPFSRKSLMFMHNGNIAGWREGVKRSLVLSIRERWFDCVEGSTDSEWAFALFLDCLEDIGYDPDSDKYTHGGFGHTVLRKAILRTISRINAYVADAKPADSRSLLNFAVTDGKSVVCTRYVSSRTDEAASLYWSSGTSWQRDEEWAAQNAHQNATNTLSTPSFSSCDPDSDANTKNRPTAPATSPAAGALKSEFKMLRQDRGADIVLIASEPLTFERDDWVTLPTNSTITVIHEKQTVLIHPVVDEFYHPSPAHPRSGGFVASQGLGLVRGDEGQGVGGGRREAPTSEVNDDEGLRLAVR